MGKRKVKRPEKAVMRAYRMSPALAAAWTKRYPHRGQASARIRELMAADLGQPHLAEVLTQGQQPVAATPK